MIFRNKTEQQPVPRARGNSPEGNRSGFRPRRQAGCGRSFTLVELLVVIGIISLLAGMLLPALHNALDVARKIGCAGKLRQIGLATQLYSSDFGGGLPYAYGRHFSEVLGAWSIPKTAATIPHNKYHDATTLLIAGYLTGPVTSRNDTSHVLRCPANQNFTPLGVTGQIPTVFSAKLGLYGFDPLKCCFPKLL